MKTPCHGCMSRRDGCHIDCEKYLAFRERLADRHKAQARERVLNTFAIEKSAKTAKIKQSFQK